MKTPLAVPSYSIQGDILIASCNFSSSLYPKDVSPSSWKSCNDAYEFTWSNDLSDDLTGISSFDRTKLAKSMGFCPQNRCQLFNLSNVVNDGQCPDSLCYTKIENGGLSFGACCFQNGEFNYGELIGFYNKTTWTPKPIYKKSRIVLADPTQQDESYMSFINANRIHDGIIATQCPMHNTINDVKRMIVEQNSTMWIQLAPFSSSFNPLQNVYNGRDLKTDCAVFPNIYLTPYSYNVTTSDGQTRTLTYDYSAGVSNLHSIDNSDYGLTSEEDNSFLVQSFTLTYFTAVVDGLPYVTFDPAVATGSFDGVEVFPTTSAVLSTEQSGKYLGSGDKKVLGVNCERIHVKKHPDDNRQTDLKDCQVENADSWSEHSILVDHVWYSKWADFEVPPVNSTDQQNLKVLARKAADVIVDRGNVVVSCQSGRGRSGTFSALILGQLQNATSHSELVDIIVGIREHRDGLVETPAQYRFVAESLNIPASLLNDDCSTSSCITSDDGGGTVTPHYHHHLLRSGVELFLAFLLGVVCAVVGTIIVLRRKAAPKAQSASYQSIVDNSIHNNSL